MSYAKALLCVASAIALCIASPSQTNAGLLVNGDFESGLAGWTVTDLAGGSGSFFSQPNDGSLTPLSTLGTAINPLGGLLFAVSDQTGPGTHALTQSFSVPAGSSVAMSFDMFLNDYSGLSPVGVGLGLDHTGGTNQHARVDILTSTADPLSTAIPDVVASVLVPVPAPAAYFTVNPWISSPVFDLSAELGAGGTFQVRFAETDNSGNFHLGVDNVVIEAVGGQVPEPTSLAIFALGIAPLTGIRRRRR
tara:strand:- start:87771 stop:88517 length:747 start_codon:yes stop_codon:yes gene_type:complete